MGSDASAACGRRSELSEWPGSTADAGGSPRKMSGYPNRRNVPELHTVNTPAGVMELVDVVDSKSTAGDSVPVRVRPPAPKRKTR